MKSLAIASLLGALILAVLSVPASVLARDHDDRGHPRGGPPASYHPGGGPPVGYRQPPPEPGYGAPGGYRGGYSPPRTYAAPTPFGGQARYREPGDWNDYPPAVGGPPRWRRGEYLPPGLRGEVVGDYNRYHLRRPPPGYYWYRSGDDYVLAAIASGLIFEVVAGDGY